MGQKVKNTKITPEHLGGHNNKTWIDQGALDYLIKNYKVKSFLDIGCGPGDMLQVAQEAGLEAFGIDGDPLFQGKEGVQIHDYTLGPISKKEIQRLPVQGYYDVGWNVEFLEHVEAEFIPNFFTTFQLCKYMVITHATPKQGGYHHVNEQFFDYWEAIFKDYGFKASAKMTLGVREHSTMRRKMPDRVFEFVDDEVICHIVKKSFMEKNGWVFVNQALS